MLLYNHLEINFFVDKISSGKYSKNSIFSIFTILYLNLPLRLNRIGLEESLEKLYYFKLLKSHRNFIFKNKLIYEVLSKKSIFYVYVLRNKVKSTIKTIPKYNILASSLSLRSKTKESWSYMCCIMTVGNFSECGFLIFSKL